MLTATIEQPSNATAFLFDAINAAAEANNLDEAEAYLRQRLSRSRIYRVERETPETVAVRHDCFRRRVVARVGAD